MFTSLLAFDTVFFIMLFYQWSSFFISDILICYVLNNTVRTISGIQN